MFYLAAADVRLHSRVFPLTTKPQLGQSAAMRATSLRRWFARSAVSSRTTTLVSTAIMTVGYFSIEDLDCGRNGSAEAGAME
jgi:hypothetical protein